MVTEIEPFESVIFLFVGSLKSEFYKKKKKKEKRKKGGHTDELLARILDAAASIKKRVDQLRRTTRELRKRIATYIEVGDGIFEHLF
jgi:hypothetical protein